MSTQNSSRSAIIASAILGKVSSVIGYAIAIVLGFPLVIGAFTGLSEIMFVLVFLAFAAWLIVVGIRIKRRIKRFKRYISIITVENQISIENIAAITLQSVDFVARDLQKMIDKKFFVNAHIDRRTNEIILQKRTGEAWVTPVVNNKPAEMITVSCSGCGAVNSIQKGTVGECEFCGSPLAAK